MGKRRSDFFNVKSWIARRFGMMEGGMPKDSEVLAIIVEQTGWPLPRKADKQEFMARFWKLIRDQERGVNPLDVRTKSNKSRDFYQSQSWRAVRYQALVRSSGRCECCGARASESLVLHVDHIQPRSKYPSLALDPTNLQVLCEACNLGKSNRDATDWRVMQAPESLQ